MKKSCSKTIYGNCSRFLKVGAVIFQNEGRNAYVSEKYSKTALQIIA